VRGRPNAARAVVVSLAVLAGVGVTTGASAAIPPGGNGPTVATRAVETRTVSTWTETFVDTSRSTSASASVPAKPTRTLETAVYLPSARRPLPLIVFSHGSDGHPEKFTELLTAWAEAGYVVAAPAFPLTNSHVPKAEQVVGDVAEQPADVSFVIDEMLRLNTSRKSRLHGAIDPKHIGAGGLSLGGATTYGVTFNECCRDRRIRAAEVLDGIVLPVGDGSTETLLDGRVPLLIAHSDTDPALPYSRAQATYALAAPPVWFVTLHGASHASQWENEPTPYDAIGRRITIDFWNATLRGDKRAFSRLKQDATVAGLSSIEARR
jgi:predicted dienelactone hydrolase